MSRGLYPGTFDPPTLGHLDVIERAAKVCQHLIVGVAKNTSKQTLAFTIEERLELLKNVLAKHRNIEVVSIEGLVVEFAQLHQVDFLIRGLRAFSDREHEFQMALANKKLGNIETLFFMADAHYAHISSSLIREIASSGHHLKDFVPASLEPTISARFTR